MSDKKELLRLAGIVSTAARHVVGGQDINGFPIQTADIDTVKERCDKLRIALDAYDAEIVRRTMEK